MSWDAISTLAEVVSAVAVVISLIYVGLQVRQSNELSRANAVHIANTQYSHVMEQLATNPALASLYRKATSGEDLNEDEFVQYSAFLVSYFVFLEDVHTQQNSGLYAIELQAENITQFMAQQSSDLLASAQSREWWEKEAPKFLSPEFYDVASKNIPHRTST